MILRRVSCLHSSTNAGDSRQKHSREHGIKQIGFWTAQVGRESTQLMYMMQWESYGERNRCYDAIHSNLERALDVMLKPTDFSPLQ